MSGPAWAQNEKHRSKCCGGYGIAYHGVPGKRPLLRALGRDWRNPDPCGISISMGPSAREFTNSLKSLAGAEVAPGWRTWAVVQDVMEVSRSVAEIFSFPSWASMRKF